MSKKFLKFKYAAIRRYGEKQWTANADVIEFNPNYTVGVSGCEKGDFAVGLNPAIQMRDGEYIPTLAELYLICLNRKAINAAMRFAGGQELADWYWSSTECSATSAWGLNLRNGRAYTFAKASDTNRVRPVSAFIS